MSMTKTAMHAGIRAAQETRDKAIIDAERKISAARDEIIKAERAYSTSVEQLLIRAADSEDADEQSAQ